MAPDDHCGCGGLTGGCLTCSWLYRMTTHPGTRNAGGGGERVPLCMACSHKHWAYERCADHQWDDPCPYEGTTCTPGGCEPEPLAELVRRVKAEQPELLREWPLPA